MKKSVLYSVYTLLILGLFSLIILGGCKGKSTSTESAVPAASELTKESLIKEVFEYPLPTSFEVTNMLVKAEAPCILDVCNPTLNADKYITQAKKALNLGVYGADLCYMVAYNQSQETMNYLNVSRKLVEDLNISTAFNEATAAKAEANINNKDSLIAIISDSFYETYNSLMRNKQDKLSAMVMAGSWIESLYITSEISITAKKKEAITDILLSHKNSLDKLMEIVEPLNADSEIKPIYEDLKRVQSIYASFGNQKPTTVQLSRLVSIAEEIRGKLIG